MRPGGLGGAKESVCLSHSQGVFAVTILSLSSFKLMLLGFPLWGKYNPPARLTLIPRADRHLSKNPNSDRLSVRQGMLNLLTIKGMLDFKFGRDLGESPYMRTFLAISVTSERKNTIKIPSGTSLLVYTLSKHLL